MWRTLRTKLTLLTIAVGIAVLLVSTILVLHLSTRLLEIQARDYADLLAYQVTFSAEMLWRSADRESLVKKIQSLTEGRGDISAIDVFFFDGIDHQVVSSQPAQAVAPLSQEERQAVQEGRKLVAHTWREGRRWMSVLSPLREKNDQIGGAVRIWTRVIGL